MAIIQVYPEIQPCPSIEGLYLNELPLATERSIVYGNFISSLDGRIAIKKEGDYELPAYLTNKNDLRLFLELRAQADCIITHSGYMRSLAAGKLGNILNIEKTPEYADLINWQTDNAVPVQPTVVICSNSLDFPLATHIAPEKLIIATSKNGNQRLRGEWQKQGCRVIEAGDEYVEGGILQSYLAGLRLRRTYLCAGPQLFESYLAARCIDRLYVTLSMQLLGYKEHLTMVPQLKGLQNFGLQLRRMILDTTAGQPAQIFATFDCPTD